MPQQKSARPKRFRLSLVGALEDQPRLVRAYGRACGGDVALLLRPREGRGLLVHMVKDAAHVWEPGASDAPQLPRQALAPRDAVARVRSFQKDLPEPGPATLRGQWTGYLGCDDDQPQVVLQRKLASYGTLVVTSDPAGGWRWKFERVGKWFTEAAVQEGGPLPRLSEAIEAGVLGAMRLVRQACSFRDTRRRAAVDREYGALHPVKPPREGKDPTERIQEPRSRRGRKAAATAEASAEPAPIPAPGPCGQQALLPGVEAPKKRGRPKKADPAPAPAGGDAAPAPKKRGRPKKAAPAPAVDAATDQLLIGAFADAVRTALAAEEAA